MPPKPPTALQELMNFKALAGAPPPSSEDSSSEDEVEVPQAKVEDIPPRAPSPVPSKVGSDMPDDVDVDGVRPLWRPIEGARPITAFDAHLIMREMSPKVAFTVLITRLHRGANNPSPADGTNSKWSDIFAPAPPDDPRGFHEARWPETLPPYRPITHQPGESAWADNQEYAFECVFACSNSHFAVARRLKMMKQQPTENERLSRLSGPLCKMRFRMRGSSRVPARLAQLLGDDPTPFSRSSPNLLPSEFDLCTRVVLEVAGQHEPECECAAENRDVLSPPLPWPRMSPRGELWVAQAAYRYRDMTWGALLRDVAVLRSLGPPPWVPIGNRPAEPMDHALMALYGQCFTKVQRLLRGSSQRRVTVGGLSERVEAWRNEGAQGGTVRVEARVRRGGNPEDPGIIVASHVPALAAYAAFCAASSFPPTLTIEATAAAKAKGWRVVPIMACVAGQAVAVAYTAVSACTRAAMEWSLQAVAAAAPLDFAPKYVIGDVAETVRAAVQSVWPGARFVASFDDVLRSVKTRMDATNMVSSQKLALLELFWRARCTRSDAIRRDILAERPECVPEPVWEFVMTRFGPGALPPLDPDLAFGDPALEPVDGGAEESGVIGAPLGAENEMEGEDMHSEGASRVVLRLDAVSEARTLAQNDTSYGPAALTAEAPEEFVDRIDEAEEEPEEMPPRIVQAAGARGATRAAARQAAAVAAAAAAAAAATAGDSEDEEALLPQGAQHILEGERPLPLVREPVGDAAFPRWSLADFEDGGVSSQPSNLLTRGVKRAVGWRISGVVRMLGDAIHEWVSSGATAPTNFDLPQPGRASPKFHYASLAERWSSLAPSTTIDPVPIRDETQNTIGHVHPIGYRERLNRPPVPYPVPGRVEVRGQVVTCSCREFRECLSCVHCALVLTERYHRDNLRPDSRSLRGLAQAEEGLRKRPRGRASVTAADSRAAAVAARMPMTTGRMSAGLHPHAPFGYARPMRPPMPHGMGPVVNSTGLWNSAMFAQQQAQLAQQQAQMVHAQQQAAMGAADSPSAHAMHAAQMQQYQMQMQLQQQYAQQQQQQQQYAQMQAMHGMPAHMLHPHGMLVEDVHDPTMQHRMATHMVEQQMS